MTTSSVREPSARRDGRRARVLALAVPLAAATLCAATAAPAGAATPSCPTSADRVRLSWGVSGPDADVRTTTGRWPARSAFVEDGVHRSGLGLGVDPEVRTSRSRRGVGSPVLCAGGKIRARLPELSRGTVIGAASANGSWVAWRTAKRGALGRVYVGQVVDGRLRAARYRETVRGVAGEIVNGNLVVTATGTVAWTIGPGPQDRDVHSVGAVWPRGGEVRQVPVADRAAPTDQAGSQPVAPHGRPIFVLNDHEVQVGDRGAQPFAFQPPTAGPCPDIIDGRTSPLAGWRFSVTSRSSLSFAPKSSTTSRSYLVCDPASGRYLAVGSSTYGYGVAGHDDLRTVVRSGDDLVLGRESFGPLRDTRSDDVEIVDVTTGASRHMDGWLAVPGSTPPAKTPFGPDPASIGPAVAAAPGVLAWVERSDAGPSATLTVEDAGGTRRLSTGTSITGLQLDGGRLRWTTDGVPGDAPVTPVAGAAFAVGPSVDAYDALP